MAYNNNPTNTGRKLTGSNGVYYYGKGPSGDKALNVKYLDQSIVLSIHNPLPSGSQSISSKYDYKTGIDIYMRGKTAKQVAKMLRKALDEMYGNEEISSRSIDSGASLIEVCDGKKHGIQGGVTIAIYNEIGADKTSSAMDVFQFNTDTMILDYDHSAGTYSTQVIDTDIEFLIDQLVEFGRASTNAQAHMVKKELSYDMNKIISRQLQVCGALGIKNEIPSNRPSVTWTGGNTSSGAIKSGKSSDSASLEDLMADLE